MTADANAKLSDGLLNDSPGGLSPDDAPEKKSWLESVRQNKGSWQKFLRRLATFFNAMAELSNIGIAVHIVAHWMPVFEILAASGPIFYLTMIADPLIYCFRAAIRLTHLIGHYVFHIEFDIDAHEPSQEQRIKQTIGDVFSLICFALAITFFLGAIASPVGITIAWTLGLVGLASVWYFDYHLPERYATKAVDQIKPFLKPDDPKFKHLQHNSHTKKVAKWLYLATLTVLGLLLICGSAAAFAPPVLVAALLLTAKIGGMLLTGITGGRFLNFVYTKVKNWIHPLSPEERAELAEMSTEDVEQMLAEYENQPQPAPGLAPVPKPAVAVIAIEDTQFYKSLFALPAMDDAEVFDDPDYAYGGLGI